MVIKGKRFDYWHLLDTEHVVADVVLLDSIGKTPANCKNQNFMFCSDNCIQTVICTFDDSKRNKSQPEWFVLQ